MLVLNLWLILKKLGVIGELPQVKFGEKFKYIIFQVIFGSYSFSNALGKGQ